MVQCKFWASGFCKHGNSCRFEHSGPGGSGGGQNRFSAFNNNANRSNNTFDNRSAGDTYRPSYNSNNNHNNRSDSGEAPFGVRADAIEVDLAKERPIWPLSCYGPGRDAPRQLFGGHPIEQSPEEMRLIAYQAMAKGDPQAAIQAENTLLQQINSQIQKCLSDTHGAANYVVDGKDVHPNRIDECISVPDNQWANRPSPNQTPQSNTSSSFGQPQSGFSSFGQPSNLNQGTAFGQPSAPGAASAFGKPSGLGTSSTFGQPAQPAGSAFGQPSALGGGSAFGKPSSLGSTSAFGQPAAANATPGFGQTSTPAFGQKPAFGQGSQPGPAFGQSSQLGQNTAFGQQPNQPSAFGQPSQPGPASAFGQPSQPGAGSAFGQPSQPGSTPAFGQPSQSGQASGFGKPAFGAPSQPSAFGSQPQTNGSAFGKPSQPAFGAPAFGSPAAPQTTSAFGSAPTSSAPASRAQNQTASAFGTPNTINQPTAFGQPAQPTSTFPTTNGVSTTPSAFSGGAATTSTPSKFPPSQTDARTYNPDGTLATFRGLAVSYQIWPPPEPENPRSNAKRFPFFKPNGRDWERIWLTEIPPPNKAAEPIITPDTDLAALEASYKFAAEQGTFKDGVMPEIAPKREWVDFNI